MVCWQKLYSVIHVYISMLNRLTKFGYFYVNDNLITTINILYYVAIFKRALLSWITKLECPFIW